MGLFRRDCASEGAPTSHDLLPARLEEVNEQLFAASHSPGGVEEQVSLLISHPQADTSHDFTVVGSFHHVGLKKTAEKQGGDDFIKAELAEQPDEISYCPGVRSSDRCNTVVSRTPRKRSRGTERLISDDLDFSMMPAPKRSKSTTFVRKEVLKRELLQHWQQFELRETLKRSNIDLGDEGLVMECPSSSFQKLLNAQDGPDAASQKAVGGVSIDDAHSIVSFVTAVASPEALIQLKQALIGWRTQGMTTELMKASGISLVLKALDHLEAQNAFTTIATRIKLVQLAEAVDVANFNLPAPKGRGNPIVKWLSTQYKLFLHAEYPELMEGGKSWNTKLDDIKRKVRAGRRWQQMIKLFGAGIIGLVPSFASGSSHNHNFNKMCVFKLQ